MKMKMIINNIAFCNVIIFFLGLGFAKTFKQNIILLQKKEFSLTKLIPKGFNSHLFYLPSAKPRIGFYCLFYYLGLLSYIINNIAINTYKIITALTDNILFLQINSVAKGKACLPQWLKLSQPTLLIDLVASAGLGNLAYNFNPFHLSSVTFTSISADKKEQEEFITINKNESEIKGLKLFRDKELFPSPAESSIGGLALVASGYQVALSTHPTDSTVTKNGVFKAIAEGNNNSNPSIVAEPTAYKKKESAGFTLSNTQKVELKPLLFNYLITKNNQNGIGLDLNNKNYNFQTKPAISNGHSINIISLGEKKNWYLSEDLIKLISAFFKSIYCLISKPKFINTPDKIIIEILYFITIPDYKIFKWYNFIYQATPASTLPSYPSAGLGKVDKGKINYIKRRNKSIKLILRKNNLIKKTLFKLNNTNITKLYFNKFVILFKLLSSYFKKPIEFNLIRLHKSNYDSNILAQLFYLILKKKNIRLAIHNLYTKNKFSSHAEGKAYPANSLSIPSNGELAEPSNFIPAYISGLYINIGGRLMREPIIPRKTTKKFEKGAIATGKVNFVDTARITKKNKKGAYTIKIAFAQNFMLGK